MSLSDLFFPPRCIFCSEPLPHGHAPLVCAHCAITYAPATGVHVIPAGECYYALPYRDEVRRAILAFKFRGKPQYAKHLAHFLAPIIADLPRVDCITFVPVSPLRLMTRGYDQSKLLAEAVGRMLDIPVRPLLCKSRLNRRQSRLTHEDRFANVQNVFRMRGNVDLADCTVVLIDDIVTTGATISECAAVLRNADANVVCVALAH